tara:strand:+ start:2905 stop:3456 length:552 start_codon:yes stop_codon:yes gene_type:complete
VLNLANLCTEYARHLIFKRKGNQTMITPFTYFCNLKGNYDGDSVTLDIDLGCSTWLLGEKTRLYGIDTPEIRGSNKEFGELVRDRLSEFIAKKQKQKYDLIVQTKKDKSGKFGRLLGTLFLQLTQDDEVIDFIDVNIWLINQAYALPYHGGSKDGFAERHAKNWSGIAHYERTKEKPSKSSPP